MKNLYEYICRFSPVTPEEFDRLSGLLEKVERPKKTMLTRAGEVERYLCIISSGLVRKYFLRKKDEVVTQLAREGDLVCSSVSFLAQEPSAYFVETLEPCSLLAISYDNLQKLYSLGAHTERLGRLITIDWLLQKEQWEHDRLRQQPRERFIRFVRENGDLVQRIPQKQLASYLNMKPETFSRYKHLLKGGAVS